MKKARAEDKTIEAVCLFFLLDEAKKTESCEVSSMLQQLQVPTSE
jgi:hypothetical protein